MKRLFYLVASLLFMYKAVVFTTGCAQIIPPTGGPRDSLPPVLLGALPKDSTTGFNAKRIILAFDEYVQLEKAQEEIIVSPVPKVMPVIEARLREVSILIKDTLEENTTYSIDFGKSLKDLNEGNPFKNFTYVFSTGSYIDSGNLSGKVVIAETGKVDTTIVAMLHRNFEDSAVAKEKPRYYTRLDSLGRFTFKNIAPGQYHLFALKDVGGQKMYMRGSDLFAFYDSIITVGADTGAIRPVLFAFTEYADEKKSGVGGGRAAPAAKSNAPKKEKKLGYTTNLESNQQDLLSDLVFTFSDSLVEFNEDKFHFSDTLFNPVQGYTLSGDTTGRVIRMQYPWQEGQEFKIILEKDIVKDSAGVELAKADTITFKTKKKADYGTLKIRAGNLDTSQHVVFLFLKGDKVEKAYPVTGKELNFELFHTGDYDIRILYDRNRNGKWDTGNYWEKLQPEKVISTSKKYTIRANWDNEITIELPASPPQDVMK
ncbi:MAG: Ig-like domain-containing protein [Chitinophagaceae bacterium]|nr:Ig-like domain-containing protein [Chitinophagaceae bacterium]